MPCPEKPPAAARRRVGRRAVRQLVPILVAALTAVAVHLGALPAECLAPALERTRSSLLSSKPLLILPPTLSEIR